MMPLHPWGMSLNGNFVCDEEINLIIGDAIYIDFAIRLPFDGLIYLLCGYEYQRRWSE